MPINFPLAKIVDNFPLLMSHELITKYCDKQERIRILLQTNFLIDYQTRGRFSIWEIMPQDLKKDPSVITAALTKVVSHQHGKGDYFIRARNIMQGSQIFITTPDGQAVLVRSKLNPQANVDQQDTLIFSEDILKYIYQYREDEADYREAVLALREDLKFIGQMARFHVPTAYGLASDKWKKEMRIWVKFLQSWPDQLKLANLFFNHTHRELWLGLLAANGMFLQFTPELLKDDMECVELARRISGDQVLQFASPRLRSGASRKRALEITEGVQGPKEKMTR
jgi:hypothetical protein